MIKNMLQAASKMLAQSKEEKVVCAKIIIDEIITGMTPQKLASEDLASIFDNVDASPIPENTKPSKKKQSTHEPKGKVVVEHGKIISIEGVDLDKTMIELDGKVMTCAEAIGKSFQSGKIL